MAGIFETQGISFTSIWDAFASPGAAAQLTALKATGANTVSLVPQQMQDTNTSSTFNATSPLNTNIAVMAALVDQAHAEGLSVTLSPHIDRPDGGARALFQPDNPDLWFANYTNFIVNYARMAQAHGVEMLSIGTELDGVMGSAFAARWSALIGAVRAVYSGKLTYQADGFAVGNVTFWKQLDVISVDAYLPVATDTAPTVASVVNAWHSIPTNDWLAQRLDYKSPVQYFHDLAAKYNMPLQFGELGYRATSDAGIDPGIYTSSTTIDPAVQTALYQGFFETFSRETSWFKGVNLWTWSSTPSATVDTAWTLQHAPALPTIEQWFAGAHNASVAAAAAAAAASIGVNPLAGKLVIAAKGTSAGGVDALMTVQLDGQTLGTVSVPRHADGSTTSFTFDLPQGSLGKLVITFPNDAIIGTEDRNLMVRSVSVNGIALDAAESVNTNVPGTLDLWSYGTITWDLSAHPELTGQPPANLALVGTTVLEDQPAGTVVGIASAIDPQGQALTYALTSDAGGLFAIDPRTGVLTTTAPLDDEKQANYALTVTATDTSRHSATLNVGVTVGELPIIPPPSSAATSSPAAAAPVISSPAASVTPVPAAPTVAAAAPAAAVPVYASFTDIRVLAAQDTVQSTFHKLVTTAIPQGTSDQSYQLASHSGGLIVLGSDYFDPHLI